MKSSFNLKYLIIPLLILAFFGFGAWGLYGEIFKGNSRQIANYQCEGRRYFLVKTSFATLNNFHRAYSVENNSNGLVVKWPKSYRRHPVVDSNLFASHPVYSQKPLKLWGLERPAKEEIQIADFAWKFEDETSTQQPDQVDVSCLPQVLQAFKDVIKKEKASYGVPMPPIEDDDVALLWPEFLMKVNTNQVQTVSEDGSPLEIMFIYDVAEGLKATVYRNDRSFGNANIPLNPDGTMLLSKDGFYAPSFDKKEHSHIRRDQMIESLKRAKFDNGVSPASIWLTPDDR